MRLCGHRKTDQEGKEANKAIESKDWSEVEIKRSGRFFCPGSDLSGPVF